MNFNQRNSTLDLYKICNDLGVTNVKIIRKYDLKKTIEQKKFKNIIINLDDYGGGSHWVCCNTEKKLYFDSYAQLPPFGIPNSYKRSSMHIECTQIRSTKYES